MTFLKFRIYCYYNNLKPKPWGYYTRFREQPTPEGKAKKNNQQTLFLKEVISYQLTPFLVIERTIQFFESPLSHCPGQGNYWTPNFITCLFFFSEMVERGTGGPTNSLNNRGLITFPLSDFLRFF